MQEYNAPPRTKAACPVCQWRLDDGDLFCARCGTFIKGENGSAEALNMPIVHLLTQVASLQQELLRQFRSGQAVQARQFQRALQVQAEQFNRSLAHAAEQTQLQEEKLQRLVRWTAALAALAVAFIFFAFVLA
jgi:uncharacterized Zn finger protein (UPF0148 family)